MMNMNRAHTFAHLSLLVLLALAVAACDRNTARGKPKSAPLNAKAGPAAAPAAKKAAGGALAGTVAETLDSAGYTYIKIKTGAGEKWAAVRKAPIKVGQKVAISNPSEMKNFKSPTLNRVFPSIYFGSLGGGGKGKGPHGMGMGGPHGKGKGMVHGMGKGGPAKVDVSKAHAGLGKKRATIDKPIPKAEGAAGQTVAGVYANKAGLKDKKVAVRGKVVKMNRGIMGRNWLHLQDGSGSVAAANFDLTVTSKGVAEVGQVVLINGVLRLDKDFGSGYRYAVILEDGVVSK